jgi:hypothetical protein
MNKFIKLFDRLLPMVTIAFPGGYKLLVVLSITFFSGELVANQFTHAFFWVGLLVTFSGLPLAALVVSKDIYVSDKQKILITFAFSLISYCTAFVIKLHELDWKINTAVFFSLMALALYEVYKQSFLNSGNFKSLFICSLITLLFLSIFLVLFKGNQYFLIIAVFFSLLLPVAFAYFKEVKNTNPNRTEFSVVIQGFLRYVFSNALSSSLMAAFPLLLIQELGDGISSQLAQVFYISSITYLIPRVLSAQNIPLMRSKGINKPMIQSYFIKILIFVVVINVIAIIILPYFYSQWLLYYLLFAAMQCSQLTLPFSNALMVKGDSAAILKINIIATLFFSVGVLSTIFVMDKGEFRAQVLLVGFLFFQVIKLIFSYVFSRKYFKGSTNVLIQAG